MKMKWARMLSPRSTFGATAHNHLLIVIPPRKCLKSRMADSPTHILLHIPRLSRYRLCANLFANKAFLVAGSMVEAVFSDTAWHSEPLVDQDSIHDLPVLGTLKVHVPLASGSKKWPCYTYDDIDHPAEWTIIWPLGSHSFTIDHDITVIDIHDIDVRPPVPDVQAVPALFFDRDGTPESDVDSASVETSDSRAPLDSTKRERMDVMQDKSPRFLSVDWLGVSLLPGISVMDRGRPVRKSSAACWPGVGRTHPSEALEEWRPRKEF